MFPITPTGLDFDDPFVSTGGTGRRRNRRKRVRNLSSRLIAVFFGMTLLSAACGPSDSDFTEFSAYRSADGKYLVIVDSAHSKLAFGAETIRVHVVDKHKQQRHHIVTTKIANDGARMTESNIGAAWTGPDTIRFCLAGAEQQDSILKIDLAARSYTEENGSCS
jgi:hypothetical protein